MGNLPRIVGRGELGPNSDRISCNVPLVSKFLFLWSPSFRRAKCGLIGQLDKFVLIGHPLQMCFGNVTLHTITVTFSFSGVNTKGPDILQTKLKNELMWHHFEQNQAKINPFCSFWKFERACQSELSGKVRSSCKTPSYYHWFMMIM